jgi:hypothetical protein
MGDLRKEDRCAGFGAGLARGFFLAGFLTCTFRAAGFFVFPAFAGFFVCFRLAMSSRSSVEKT